MRLPPCELPRACIGSNCSYTGTRCPCLASHHAVAEPIAPAPTMATSGSATQREADDRLEVGDRLRGVDDLDRCHPHLAGRLQVDSEIVEEHRFVRLDGELVARHLVEARVGLANAD